MIYVCIPAHDEARTVGVLLWKVRKVMAEFGRDYEILVLDDASTDDTAEVLDRYRKSIPLTVIRSEERLGYGRAVERLLRETVKRAPYPKRDAALVLQADFTEDPADLVDMVKALEGGADVVCGVVEAERDDTPRAMRWSRWVANRVLGPLKRSAPVSDLLTGFRVYRVIVLKKAFREEETPVVTSGDRWAASVELMQALAPHARRIEEVPVGVRHHLRTRESRFRPLQVLKGLLRFRGGSWQTETEEEAGRAA